MVKLRLSRAGKKNYATYKIVAVHNREKRESMFLEVLGSYDPNLKEYRYKLDTERVKYWLGVGAQPTDTVKGFLIKEGLVKAPVKPQVFKKAPGKKATERAASKAQ